jgi:hypothetical protein
VEITKVQDVIIMSQTNPFSRANEKKTESQPFVISFAFSLTFVFAFIYFRSAEHLNEFCLKFHKKKKSFEQSKIVRKQNNFEQQRTIKIH